MRRSAVLLVVGGVLAVVGTLVWWMTRETIARDERTLQGTTASEAASGTSPAPAVASRAIRPRPYDATEEAAAPESAPASNPQHLDLTGKVIDERRRAVPDASIEVVMQGRASLNGKTGPDGRFRIGVGARPATGILRGAVEASDKRGRVDLRSLPTEPTTGNVIDLGTFELVESGPLTVRVQKDGAGVAGAQVFIARTRELGFGPFTTDAQGMLGPRRFPEGSYVVTAFSGDHLLRGEAQVDIPQRGAAPLDVVLAPAWRLLVTVKDGATDRPVEGARLSVESSVQIMAGNMVFDTPIPDPVPPTDAAGHSVIAGLSPERPVTVDALPSGTFGDRRGRLLRDLPRATAKPGAEELVITVGAGGETFTFPIVADETEGPPDGAEVKLSVPEGYGSALPPSIGKIAGRNLVIEGVTPGCINILATADDGRMAIVRILGDAKTTKVGSDAKFKKPRALTVSAHDRVGTSLAGYLVQCRSPGNVPIRGAIPIDATGNARIEGIYPQRVDVSLNRPNSDRWMSQTVGSADLTKPGDGHVDIIVEPERSCVLHVTVDGEKRLPPSFSIRVAGGDVGPIDEDPDDAVLRFNVRPEPRAPKLELTATAKWCPSVKVVLPSANEGAAIETAVAFVTGAKIRVHVLPPSDNIHDAGLQRWLEDTATWTRGNFGAGMRPDDAEMGKKPTELSFDALAAGRYRARDSLTGMVSAPADVAAGATAEFTLDLSRAGPITGRVEGPTDGHLESASVIIEAQGLFQPGDGRGFAPGISVRLNSDFKARVPGDRPVTVRVTHPLLRPATEGGSASVTAPGSAVVLKLVPGAEATLRIAGAPERDSGGFPRDRILIFAGKPEGDPVRTSNVQFANGIGRFGGFTAGKYTLWCDFPDAAPLVLEDVAFDDGVTDLGELHPPEGATIRCKVLIREGTEPPRVDVSAKSVDKPDYSRSHSSYSSGAKEVLVRGLGPGRFKVEVRAGDFRSAPVVHEVVSTGSGEIPLTVDLR